MRSTEVLGRSSCQSQIFSGYNPPRYYFRSSVVPQVAQSRGLPTKTDYRKDVQWSRPLTEVAVGWFEMTSTIYPAAAELKCLAILKARIASEMRLGARNDKCRGLDAGQILCFNRGGEMLLLSRRLFENAAVVLKAPPLENDDTTIDNREPFRKAQALAGTYTSLKSSSPDAVLPYLRDDSGFVLVAVCHHD